MFKTVLIAVDVAVPADAQKLLHAAKTLTQTWDSDVHVVSVMPNVGMPIVGSYFDESFESERQKAVEAQLTKAVNDAELRAVEHVLTGTVYDNVINLAASLNADLIIVGAHQPELKDYLLGSNAARVVRHSNQSVLVLRDA